MMQLLANRPDLFGDFVKRSEDHHRCDPVLHNDLPADSIGHIVPWNLTRTVSPQDFREASVIRRRST